MVNSTLLSEIDLLSTTQFIMHRVAMMQFYATAKLPAQTLGVLSLRGFFFGSTKGAKYVRTAFK